MNILNKLDGLHKPRERPRWDDLWLRHAFLISERSHDARTQCGCVFVRDNHIISSGYNGFISGIPDNVLPNFEGNEDPVKGKYQWMIHSEQNAITAAAKLGQKLDGAMAYITGKPCVHCYQLMYQAGISEIIIPEITDCVPKTVQTDTYEESLEILRNLTNNRLPIKQVKCII